MRCLRIWAIFVLTSFAVAALAHAQADAQKAFQDAEAAYAAGKFEDARAAAEKATQTDPNNAEAFLLLGQSQYQLGQIDEALASWKKTLALAPQEPLAAKMIDVLRSQRAAVADRIKLIEMLLGEKLFGPALAETEKCLADKVVSPADRARLLTLRAEALVRTGNNVEAQKLLNEVAVLFPQQADQPKIALLTGLAKLAAPETAADGTAILQKLAVDQAQTPTAKSAQYELAVFAIGQEVTPPKAEVLAKWLAENPQHPQAIDAKRTLVVSYLALSRQVERPYREAKLGDYDQKALALAAEVLSGTVRTDQANAIVQPIFEQLESYYAARDAHAAALTGLDALLKLPLSRENRIRGLRLVAASKIALANEWLADQARLGKLPDAVQFPGSPPPPLMGAVEALRAIWKENPGEGIWQQQLQLATNTQALAKAIPWPEKIEQPRGPEAWAVELAMLCLLGDDVDTNLTQSTTALVMKTVQELGQGPQPRDVKDLPLAIAREWVQQLTRFNTHPAWAQSMRWYCELLSAAAQRQFRENVKEGRLAENGKLGDLQQQLIENLQMLVHVKADEAPFARNLLAAHLQPWKDSGEWAVAEEAMKKFQDILPTMPERLMAEIDIAKLWIEQADRNHRKMQQAGITIPKELDPLHRKALARLYELQADLSDTSPLLPAIRAPWLAVIAHYNALEYYEVAEAAAEVKAEKAVPVADEFAAFERLLLQTERARRAFDAFVKQYRTPDQWTLLPEHKEVLTAWQKFVADHPTGPFASQAIGQVFGIGRLYGQQTAFKVAAGIYADFAKFAAGQKILAQKTDGRPSIAERAVLAEAMQLDAHARKLLTRWAADRKPDTPPPDKMSDEFAAAIAAYKAFLEQNADGPLAGDAVQKIMAVAAEYANYNAWSVAEGIYADLLGSKLKLSHPERLEFARGLCKLGAALPDHARQMLAAISVGEPAAPADGKPGADPFSGEGEPQAAATALAINGAVPATPGLASDKQPSPGAPPAYTATAHAIVDGRISTDTTTIDLPRQSIDDRQKDEKRDSQLLAMVRQEETARAQRVAQIREGALQRSVQPQAANAPPVQLPAQGQSPPPPLSEAELARQETSLAAAFDIFAAIRKNYPQTPTAEQARGEILVMAAHWRGLMQWQRAAALMTKFLADNPADPQLPQLRLEIARDRLSYAAKPLDKKTTRQEMLAEVEKRFDAARAELNKLQADFPQEKELQQNAQWDIAMSYLTQARTIDAVSPTLAQGQYVRTAKELRQVATKYAAHPRLGEIPQMLWNIGLELEARGYNEEAIDVWNELIGFDPLNNFAGEAGLRIAQTYQTKLKRPLRAAEAYQELNYLRGGNDVNLQNTIFQIGAELKNERRWVESLHVLEMFVDSFPRHPQAGQALTMIGQIHQTNEAWPDAIAAYRRVIDEYPGAQWVQEAKWSIAECTINLSQWKDAAESYRAFVAAYPQDGKVAEANRRIDILKDLERYQGLIDEKSGQSERKAFDAQYQIGEIVRKQLINPVKAIIEYRKVFANWPDSYLAGDALFAVGETYLSLGELTKARENLKLVAEKYPTSPSASNAMFLVGKSYEDEADKLGKVTREEQLEKSKDVAQRGAYEAVQFNRRAQESLGKKKVAEFKAAGKGATADVQEAANAAIQQQFDVANVQLFAQQASQAVETMTALELADRQDKVNAALRKAIDAYTATSKIAGGNKADSALLQMATIYDQRLKDSKAAMQVWLEIVRQFSGTNVAEDASWKIAQYYEHEGKYAEAVDAYQAFLRNYRRSPNAGAAQYAIAENYEHLGQWVKAMDSYTNYLTNFPDGPLANKAKQQINWIKTYRL
jgi:tetratricopeptide (TPR) repeat protein